MSISSRLHVRHVSNVTELLQCASQWDDLWQRSGVTHPTAQAAMIANWLNHFRADGDFQAVVVAEGKQFLAALPLVRCRKARVLPCLDVPGNEWSSAGQFLLDPACHLELVTGTLLHELHRLDCAAFWFASVPIESSWWRTLLVFARRAGWHIDVDRRYDVGQLNLPVSDATEVADDMIDRAASRGLRRQLRRAARQLERSGQVRLHMARPTDGDAALGMLETGLALEHAGWKGRVAGSVLSQPQVGQYIDDLVRQLIAKQQLSLAMLEQNGRIIAFEFGWCAKQVYHSYKIAFDERFRRYSPGQMLVGRLLQHFQAAKSPDIKAIDFLGPIDQAVGRWHVDRYPMGRVVMTPKRAVGRALVLASNCFHSRDPN